jgi:hypothetical protein
MKITIETDQDFETLKTCYRNYYGYPKNHKVTKADIAEMCSSFVSADLQDEEFAGNDDFPEKDED